MCPAHPPHGGARESIRSCGHRTLIDCLLTRTRFVKEQRRKNLQGVACKIFRALDNDDELKSKHARSGSPPRALIALSPAEARFGGLFPPPSSRRGTKCTRKDGVLKR